MLQLIFPRKCVFCKTLLSQDETDFCHSCRENTERFTKSKKSIPFVAHWTGLWYYKDNVKKSIQRFKFSRKRHYAEAYGKLLALKLSGALAEEADILSWIPVSFSRKLKRGYDQSELLCRVVGRELGIPVTPVLRKIRHTPPQSGFRDAAQRRANILGAYKVRNPKALASKRILLLDDVVTTGATASECAKTLTFAGVDKVYLAVIAAASSDKN